MTNLRSFLSLLALVAVLSATHETRAATTGGTITVPVSGSVSDIVENNVALTGDATVRTALLGGTAGRTTVSVTIHFNKVAGRNRMSGVGLEAAADQTVVAPVGSAINVQFPITVYPAGSDTFDPGAFPATATLAVRLNPATGAPIGGTTQFSIVLSPAAQ